MEPETPSSVALVLEGHIIGLIYCVQSFVGLHQQPHLVLAVLLCEHGAVAAVQAHPVVSRQVVQVCQSYHQV